MDALHYQPAHELLTRLEAGTLSSEKLVTALLARIREHNPAVNAIVTLDEAGALEQARESDQKRAAGATTGPLHGLPLTVKDTWEVAGMTCTAGARALRDHKPEHHADVVQRLEDAGAIIFGINRREHWCPFAGTFRGLLAPSRNQILRKAGLLPVIPETLSCY